MQGLRRGIQGGIQGVFKLHTPMNTPLNTPTVKSLLVSFYECRHMKAPERKSFGTFSLVFRGARFLSIFSNGARGAPICGARRWSRYT